MNQTTPTGTEAGFDLGKLAAIADRVDARGLFNAACDIRDWIQEVHAALARQAAPDTTASASAEANCTDGGATSDKESSDLAAKAPAAQAVDALIQALQRVVDEPADGEPWVIASEALEAYRTASPASTPEASQQEGE